MAVMGLKQRPWWRATSIIRPTALVGRRGAGADPHHEEDHRHLSGRSEPGRDRSRSVKLRVLEIMRIARAKGPLNRDRLEQRYRRLLDTTSRVVGQAKRFSKEYRPGPSNCKKLKIRSSSTMKSTIGARMAPTC